MGFQCSQCGNALDAASLAGGVIQCSHCGAKLKPPRMLENAEVSPAPKPVILPVVVSSNESSELAEEKAKDLRESRQQRGDDRATNGIGTAGFAIGLTTLLFLFSAAAVRKDLPIYLVFASCISVPASLLALMLSVMGFLRRGRAKLFPFLGVLVAGFLILAAIPAAFMALRHGN